MTLCPYTQKQGGHGSHGEQDLLESLVIESIQQKGMEVYYMPRELVAEDELYNEDTLSKVDDAYKVETYLLTVDGFEGEGDILSRFGLEIRDSMKLAVARKRFSETVIEVRDDLSRPREGDYIYLPLNGKIFEITFVEDESTFFQLGKLYFYELNCELIKYSSERFDTGVEEIDIIEDYSIDESIVDSQIQVNGEDLTTESGRIIVAEEFMIQEDFFNDSDYLDMNDDFIVKNESNPFSESGLLD